MPHVAVAWSIPLAQCSTLYLRSCMLSMRKFNIGLSLMLLAVLLLGTCCEAAVMRSPKGNRNLLQYLGIFNTTGSIIYTIPRATTIFKFSAQPIPSKAVAADTADTAADQDPALSDEPLSPTTINIVNLKAEDSSATGVPNVNTTQRNTSLTSSPRLSENRIHNHDSYTQLAQADANRTVHSSSMLPAVNDSSVHVDLGNTSLNRYTVLDDTTLPFDIALGANSTSSDDNSNSNCNNATDARYDNAWHIQQDQNMTDSSMSYVTSVTATGKDANGNEDADVIKHETNRAQARKMLLQQHSRGLQQFRLFHFDWPMRSYSGNIETRKYRVTYKSGPVPAPAAGSQTPSAGANGSASSAGGPVPAVTPITINIVNLDASLKDVVNGLNTTDLMRNRTATATNVTVAAP